MRKSDLLLQIAIFGLSAATVSLITFRFYPTDAIKKLKGEEINPRPHVAAQSAKTIYPPPSSISIPSISLNLTVAPGVVQNNKWTLYEDKISWLSTSEPPGRGNVILYGHNRKGLFGELDRLEIGEEITIVSGSKNYVYQIYESRRVRPNEVDVIISDKNQLTLYTCDGSFDERRLVLFAFPKPELI